MIHRHMENMLYYVLQIDDEEYALQSGERYESDIQLYIQKGQAWKHDATVTVS